MNSHTGKAFFISALLACGTAGAHTSPGGMEYSGWCCSGVDCSPIPAKTVKAVTGGYQVSVGPGDHPMLTRSHVFLIPYDKVKESTDGVNHACFFPNEDTLRCLYVPPQSF